MTSAVMPRGNWFVMWVCHHAALLHDLLGGGGGGGGGICLVIIGALCSLVHVQCFQLSDIIILVWACRKELSHQTL